MYWRYRVSGLAVRVLILAVLPGFASSLSAQVLPAPASAQPAHFLVGSGAADHCVLLPVDLCEGLPQSQSNGSPNAPTSRPSSSSEPWTVRRILKRLARDQGSLYIAPLERANAKWDAAFILGTTALVVTDRHTIGVVSRENESISRNISNVGLYGTEAAAGAIFFTGLLTDNPHARETGFITAEALLNAYPVYIGMQLIAGRERPDQGAGHGRFFQNHSTNTSFPSGHSMFTWTMAAVIAHEYPRTWVKILAYTTATAVSISRYTGREHFVSDVALGGFIGYFIGRHIFKMHCSTEFSERCIKIP
jgi:membrane-associated phospholipid phosphatase